MEGGIGTIRVVLKNKKPIRIDNVLFVPELDRRLLSASVLVERGLNVSFENGSCTIRNNQEIVTEVARKGKVYVMESVTREEVHAVEEKPNVGSAKISTWHARLGHLPINKMKLLDQCVSTTMKKIFVMDV